MAPILKDERKKVLLYGLSANPPTGEKGHFGMLSYFCDASRAEEQEKFDEVWLLPVYEHIFQSKKQKLIDFHHRMEMCTILCQQVSSQTEKENATGCTAVFVKDIEKQVALEKRETNKGNNSRIGTIDILTFLQEKYPAFSFSILLGGDTYRDFRDGKWKNSADIVERVDQILVVDRFGVNLKPKISENNNQLEESDQLTEVEDNQLEEVDLDSNKIQRKRDHINPHQNSIAGKYHFVKIPALGEVSSTMVRDNIQNEKMLADLLHPSITEYIKNNQLYCTEIENSLNLGEIVLEDNQLLSEKNID